MLRFTDLHWRERLASLPMCKPFHVTFTRKIRFGVHLPRPSMAHQSVALPEIIADRQEWRTSDSRLISVAH